MTALLSLYIGYRSAMILSSCNSSELLFELMYRNLRQFTCFGVLCPSSARSIQTTSYHGVHQQHNHAKMEEKSEKAKNLKPDQETVYLAIDNQRCIDLSAL